MKCDGKRRFIIIGIDGGTFKIINPLVKAGKLPHIQKLMESGSTGTLKSTYPPITAAAWVSFMTGKNPGKHGFFDFREYKPAEYDLLDSPLVKNAVDDDISTLHSSRFQGQTIWDLLGREGYEMSIITVPMTYPAWNVNGRMVSGYPSPDYRKPNTYPPDWGNELGQLFNISAIDYSKTEGFIKECKELVRRKGKIILDQLKRGRGDIFTVVFSSSDFAQHYFWKYMNQKDHPYSTVINEVYQEIDRVIGDILGYTDDDTSIFVISDHGFTRYPDKMFHLNAWLAREEYIGLKENKKNQGKNLILRTFDSFLHQVKYEKTKWRWFLKDVTNKMPLFVKRWASQQYFKSSLIDWKKTSAYRFKMYGSVEGIVINQKNRQEHGTVEPGEEYEALRAEIIEKLSLLNDPETGDPMISEIYRREELYCGDFLENTPDIIIRYAPEYYGGHEVDGDIITMINFDEISESGIHDQDGIFIFAGPHVNKGVEGIAANIVDVAPTVLYDLNSAVPDDMDGRIIEEAFLDAYKKKIPRYTSIEQEDQKVQESLSDDDEESMKKALKGLGYL